MTKTAPSTHTTPLLTITTWCRINKKYLCREFSNIIRNMWSLTFEVISQEVLQMIGIRHLWHEHQQQNSGNKLIVHDINTWDKLPTENPSRNVWLGPWTGICHIEHAYSGHHDILTGLYFFRRVKNIKIKSQLYNWWSTVYEKGTNIVNESRLS